MLDYTKVEKCLKGFLKSNRKLGYSVALLVTFLINGGFSYADEVVQVPSRTEIKNKIEKEQENISQILEETENSMKDIDLKIKKLTQRGEFWVKPLDKSYQLFFFTNWGNYSRNRNKTEKNFTGPEYSSSSGSSMDYGQYINGRYYGEYGIVKNPLEFVDKIDFGANITPKTVAEKTIVEKTVSAKTINLPQAIAPTVNIGEIKSAQVSTPSIGTLTVPTAPNINITAPGTITALGNITVAEIAPLNVTVSTPTVSTPATITAPTVQTPATPAGFNPRLITPPEAPADVTITPPTITPPNLTGGGANPGVRAYWWDGNDGAISQIILKAGTFDIKPGNIISVQGYDAEAADIGGGVPQGTKPTDGDHAVGQKFFHTLLNAKYSEYGPTVVINNNRANFTLIDLETEGNVNGKGTDKKPGLLDYSTYSGINGQDNGSTNLVFINKGTVNLNADGTTYYFTTSHTNGEYRTNYIDNEGIINANGKDSVIIKHSPDTNQAKAWIYSNSSNGKMVASGENSVIYGVAYSYLPNGRAAFVNEGTIELIGKKTIGIIYPKAGINSKMQAGYLVWLKSPITIKGEGTMGFVVQNSGDGVRNDKNLVKFDIDDSAKDSIGILQDVENAGISKTAAVINIKGASTKANMGIYANQGTLEVIAPHTDSGEAGNSRINISAGEGNIGILSTNSSTVNFNGDLTVTGGKGAKLVIAAGQGKINLTGDVTVGSSTNYIENAVPLYSVGQNSKITLTNPDKAKFYLKGQAVAAYAKDKAEVEMSRTTLSSTPTIKINSTDNKGIGLFANTGGKINANKHYIDVKNGSVGISVIGSGSSVSLVDGKLVYDGSGYAIYSDGQGKVDISGAELNLAGKSTAFDVDLGATTLPITLNAATRIKANSDDVIVFNLKGATGLTTVGGIEDSIKTKIETKLALGSGSLNNLFTGSTSTKYKVAAVDGGSIILGDLDKAGTSVDTSGAKKDGFQYFNRFLAQRLVATTNSGSTISAILTSADANDRYNGQVVGLEMNSSKNATSVNETAIKLVNSTLKADRIGTGAGAVGAFINYGEVNVDATSKILVEKETGNTANDGAVGVYAVNGSKVENKGTIEVGGNQSVGILGMAYRLDSSNSPVVDEFGSKAVGQGLVNVTNTNNITMSGDNAIAIYAKNNNTASATTADKHTVTNTGNITIGKSTANSTAVGIYADKVTVKPENGTIKIGEKAVGIYATNKTVVGEAGKNIGTIHYTGNEGVGIYLNGDSELKGNKVTLAETGTDLTGKIGILANLDTKLTATTEIDASNVKNVTAYYTAKEDLRVNAKITLGENSTAISGVKDKTLTYGDGTNKYEISVGKSSIGISGKENKIDLKDKAEIVLAGANSTGIYLNADNKANKEVNFGGKFKFEAATKNAIGLYALNKASVNVLTTGNIDFGTSKNNIAYYISGSEWKGNPAVTNITYSHNSNNIYLYAQGSKANDGTLLGSTVKPHNVINVNPTGTSSASEKAIGIYLDTAVKGETGKFVDNDLNLEESRAKIDVTKEGIGVYAKNASTDKYNKITLPKISSDGEKTVGVYSDGDLKLVRIGNISVSNKGVGIYANKGKIKLEDVQRVELTSAGTGIYLTNGSYLDGNKIEIKNNTTGTPAAGIYYTKGTATSQVTHNTEIEVKDGNDALALYVDGGIDLKNDKAITISKNKGNVAAFITGNSKFINNADITLEGTGTNLQQALGIYVQDGEATNNSGKTIKVKDEVTGSLSVGMAAVKSVTGAKAMVNNSGTIEVTGDVIGMYVDDNSSGTNSGTISAKNSGTMKAIGAYIKGNNASFNNTGSVSSENIALALENTTAGKITAGTLNLTADNAVGVYAKNSIVDFDVKSTTDKEKTVALFAEGNTKINKTVTSAVGKGHIGVYVKDSGVKFETGSKVVVNNGVGTDFGVGIYTDEAFNADIKTNIEQNGKETIGLFLGSNAGTGATVNYTGTIGVGNGIGVYVPTDSKFVSTNTTFNVDGGTAVYLKGGTVDLGNSGTATINFGAGGGTAIFQDGGTINTGSGLTISGSGSFLALKNANSTINSLVKVGTNGIGLNGSYDNAGSNYTLTLGSPNGKIQLDGNKATGIAAVAKNTVNPNKVDVINKGTIETISGSQTTGIYGVGANIENEAGAEINIGAKGVGIYTTNYNEATLSLINTTLKNNGKINLIGDGATGIVAQKSNTNQDFIGGEITGTKDSLIGMYFSESQAPTQVKDTTISLGNNAKGLVFENGKDFTVTATASKNKITIGNTTGINRGIGISALSTNGTVSKTDVVVGKGSLGLYAKDKKLTFDLASGKLESSDASKSSILVYADGNTSEVALNGGGTLKVGKDGIALGTKGGKITADATTTVEVDGGKGLGAYVENGGEISNKFDIKVKNAEGIGMYAKGGNLTSIAKVSEIKGNKSIGYVFENITNLITLTNPVQLTDVNATKQVGVLAQGSGNGLTLNGVSVVGSSNIGVYSSTGKSVVNNGALTLGDSAGESSIGIYSRGGVVTSGAATIGKNSLGIYGEKTSVTLNGNMTVSDKAVGILLENKDLIPSNAQINGNLNVAADGAVGIQVANSATKVTGNLVVGAGDSKGIFSVGAGDVEITNDITVGKNSVGIYKNGSGEVKLATSGSGNTSVADNGYGVFSKGAKVINNTNITVGTDAIGIYVDGNDLTSTGTVTVGDKGVGLLVKGVGKTLTSTGNISVSSNNSVGLYAGDDAKVVQSGNMTVADNNGIGIYSKGSGDVTTVGSVTVGKDSIGIYKDGKGIINVNSGSPIQTMNIDEKGYGLYYKGNSSTNSVINSNMNMSLGKEAVGIYGKNTTVNHTGDITVGETTIGSNGYSDPKVNKNSIGIFSDNSNINYKGNMVVDKPLSVGIYGSNGGNITLQSGSVLTVKNGATGIMTGQGVNSIVLQNGSIINVDGKATSPDATKANVSFGIAAYSGIIDNQGTINVTNGATGIYVAGTASLKNGASGVINVDAISKSTAKPETKASAELGGIKVTDKGEVTIGNRVINGGTVNIKGDLNMAGIGLDISTGKTVIDAKSISGVAEILPNFSKGNSEQKITIKDVFRTGGIGSFSGDVKSKSVSWIAKISKDPNDRTTTTKDITMVRLPYYSLISGERYKNLATGLEDIRAKVGANTESPIFKSLDNITSHSDFAKAVANIRGDVYSNIQERMKTVESAFDKSYNELLGSYNKTKNVDKFSVIYAGGKHEDTTFGVTAYKYNTTGVLYVNDREAFTYGGKYGWSAGVVGSNFKFEGDTNKNSKERVVSGKLGLHYQAPLNKNDDNARLKWLSRGELTVSTHRTKRYSQIGADTYENKASFYSTELSWRNIISYDYDINTNWTVKPYTGIDLSYGHIFNVKEKGEGLPLEVKSKDYFVISPNVGVETKYVLPLGAIHQVFVKADTKASYDITELYHDANQAKIRNTNSGYYKLSEPERRRGRVEVGAELGFEKENTYGVTFRAGYQGYKKSDLNYGVRFNYKF